MPQQTSHSCSPMTPDREPAVVVVLLLGNQEQFYYYYFYNKVTSSDSRAVMVSPKVARNPRSVSAEPMLRRENGALAEP